MSAIGNEHHMPVRKLTHGSVDGFLLYNKVPAQIIYGAALPATYTAADM
jgi:hypothetical protein